MVIHDLPGSSGDTADRAEWQTPGRWSRPPMPKQEESKKKEGRVRRHLSVLAVQCIACVVILLLALLLRTAGGPAYQQLCRSLQDGLMRNELLEALAVLWDGDAQETISQPDSADSPSGSDSTTSSATTPSQTTPSTGETTTPATAVSPSGTAGGRLPPEGAVAVCLRVNRVACAPLAEGTLTSGYGYRENPTGDGEGFHSGVDIAAPAGTPLASMFYGRVSAVGESATWGRYIRLDHGDGVEVLYAHCSQVLAPQGSVIRAGETVALVGVTGDVTGSHVHIQIRCDGQTYNPVGVVPVERYV